MIAESAGGPAIRQAWRANHHEMCPALPKPESSPHSTLVQRKPRVLWNTLQQGIVTLQSPVSFGETGGLHPGYIASAPITAS